MSSHSGQSDSEMITANSGMNDSCCLIWYDTMIEPVANSFICITMVVFNILIEVWTITHCLRLGHETKVSCVCLSIFFWTPVCKLQSIAMRCNAWWCPPNRYFFSLKFHTILPYMCVVEVIVRSMGMIILCTCVNSPPPPPPPPPPWLANMLGRVIKFLLCRLCALHLVSISSLTYCLPHKLLWVVDINVRRTKYCGIIFSICERMN